MTAAVDRFAAAWLVAESPPDLATYVPDGTAMRTATLLELIRIDQQNRSRRTGLAKPLSSYRDEFPELPGVDELRVLIDGSDTTLSATLAATTATTTRSRTDDPLERLDVGQRVDEFDLLTSLGSGAFARVFLARQRSMQRLVAVKISENRGTEPQTLAQLDHDYIVRVFDQRVLPDRDLRLLYMQYLPGGTLLDVLRVLRKTTWTPDRTGKLLLDVIDRSMESKGEIRPTDSSIRDEIEKLSWPETIAWLGRRLAEALDYAGRQQILHRDVKPANVLLTAEGVPKLADFNISFSGALPDTSPVAYFGGSLSYMSPEQLAAVHPERPTTPADLDTRSDIYSLGVVLWELLSARKPFPAGEQQTLDDMLDHRLAGVTAETLGDLPPDTPATLRRILLTCLAPDRDDRWASGAELAKQFDLCLDAHARNLVDPPPRSWRLRTRAWFVPIVALCAGVPNVLASLYNIQQNQLLVFTKLSAVAQERTQTMALLMNSVGFTLGALLIIYLLRRLIRVPRTLGAHRSYDLELLAHAREDALHLGDRIVAVTFGLWMLSGLSFPIGMYTVDDTIPVSAYVHFFFAQILCAAIAVAYPFFLLTFYAVRCIYPAFLPYGAFGAADDMQLRSLQRRGNLYLLVAASVPLLAVAGVTFLSADEIELVIVPVRVVCLGGIAAFLLTYWLFRLSEADMRALGARARGSFPEA